MRVVVLGAALAAVCGVASAEETPLPVHYDWQETWRWGISEHRLDIDTDLIGWRFGDSWYFGHEDGEEDGLALIWRGKNNQMSLSEDGVRYTRRF